jgi:hypothetical protein
MILLLLLSGCISNQKEPTTYNEIFFRYLIIDNETNDILFTSESYNLSWMCGKGFYTWADSIPDGNETFKKEYWEKRGDLADAWLEDYVNSTLLIHQPHYIKWEGVKGK